MSAPTRHQPPGGGGGSGGGGSQDLLYAAGVAAPSHAERARTLCALAPSATLCTLGARGHPYGSLALFALCADGAAALLVSDLAEHTRNLRRDPRCSLLVAEGADGNPLARGRVTLVGEASVCDGVDMQVRDAFLKRHTSAIRYADFGDFNFWRINVETVRYIGGFGRMSFVDIESWKGATADAVATGEGMQELLKAANESARAQRIARVAHRFSSAKSVASVRVSTVDQYGFEVDAETELGPRPIRVAFERPATSVDDADKLLADLEKTAN